MQENSAHDTQTIDGFILELYRAGVDEPCYISAFEPKAVAGFNGYTPNKEEAVVFESREALLPLAAIEVESLMDDEDPAVGERFVFDGFRILPFSGVTEAQLVGDEELEFALNQFEAE